MNDELMGSRIRSKRIEKSMTMEQLGNLVGVQKSAVNKWEHGIVKNMKRSIISKLANILDVSPAWLMGFDEEAINALAAEQEEVINSIMEYDEKIRQFAVELAELDLTEDEMKEVYDYAKYVKSKRK